MTTDRVRMISIHFQRHKISTIFLLHGMAWHGMAWPFQYKPSEKSIWSRAFPWNGQHSKIHELWAQRRHRERNDTHLTRVSKQTRCQHKNNVDANHLNAYTTENALHNPSFIHRKAVCEEISFVRQLSTQAVSPCQTAVAVAVTKTISPKKHSRSGNACMDVIKLCRQSVPLFSQHAINVRRSHHMSNEHTQSVVLPLHHTFGC